MILTCGAPFLGCVEPLIHVNNTPVQIRYREVVPAAAM